MTTRVVGLRTQFAPENLVVGRDPIRLRWRIEGGSADDITAFEVQAAPSDAFEPDRSSSSLVTAREGVMPFRAVDPLPGLSSREQRFYRVRSLAGDEAGEWSEILRVEAGLLHPDDWQARGITLRDDPGSRQQSPAPLLRREFDVPAAVTKARLYVTSLGLNQVTVNGSPVSSDLLAPGWTSYRKRLIVDTYDVTTHLRPGPNVIAAALGDGWWRGRIGWEPNGDRCRYGDQLALLAQLEIELADGTRLTVATDRNWRASTGEILSADLYDGCRIDLRSSHPGWDGPEFDDGEWSLAATVPFDLAIMEPRSAPPVRVVKTITPSLERRPDGTFLLDGGQNVAGFVELHVRGKAGAAVTVRHAEVLEPDGALHVRSLRSAKATDSYVLREDGSTSLRPEFTFHGFRYAEVATDAELIDARFVAISSAHQRVGSFSCSDAALNKFHDNVVWSQLDNFVSLPTDCPQRDERLGWTGDAQAFAPTSLTLFDSVAFWSSWLRDLALDQDPVLGVSTVVPDVVLHGEPRFGRAGWSDAATIVPWSVYEADGEPAILEQQLESMRLHVESLVARCDKGGLLPDSFQFGDWLDPDAPSDQPWLAKADSTFLANAFFAYSARLLSRSADIVGQRDVAQRFAAVADRVSASTWQRWGGSANNSQTACAVSIALGIAPAADHARIGETLAQLVRESNGRVSTGFLGTPLVLPALGSTSHWDEAFLMLLRREPPSWLYQVERGATTVWERWDAIRPDGSIHDGRMAPPPDLDEAEEGHMLSFNHYAYGAMIDWVYRHVAGLSPDVDDPGYHHVIVAPRPSHGLEWAKAQIDTRYGPASIEWKLDKDEITGLVTLPPGTSGTFVPPVSPSSTVTVDGSSFAHDRRLSAGAHTFEIRNPDVADPARALSARLTE